MDSNCKLSPSDCLLNSIPINLTLYLCLFEPNSSKIGSPSTSGVSFNRDVCFFFLLPQKNIVDPFDLWRGEGGGSYLSGLAIASIAAQRVLSCEPEKHYDYGYLNYEIFRS